MKEPPRYNTNPEPQDQRNLAGYGSGLGAISIKPPVPIDAPSPDEIAQQAEQRPSNQLITSNGPTTAPWQPTSMPPVTNQGFGTTNQNSLLTRARGQASKWKPLLLFGGSALGAVLVLRYMRKGRSTSTSFVDDEEYPEDEGDDL